MHERAAVSETAQRLVEAAGGRPVTAVTLRLSPETDPGVVSDVWRSSTLDTPVANARLTCVIEDHGLACLECGNLYRGDKLTQCPRCGGNGLIIDLSPQVALADWETDQEPA